MRSDERQPVANSLSLPSPEIQARQIVTTWRAVVGSDDLLVHYIRQTIEENRVDTASNHPDEGGRG